jgi:release factor glutamine methyltransferase
VHRSTWYAPTLRGQAFDVVVFNPPYLPTAPHEHVPGPLDAAFDGGPTGRAVVERLLATWPRPSPPLLLVTSSLQGEDALAELAHAAGLHVRRLGERRFPHERLALQRLEASAATPGSSPRNAEGF